MLEQTLIERSLHLHGLLLSDLRFKRNFSHVDLRAFCLMNVQINLRICLVDDEADLFVVLLQSFEADL